MSRLANANKRSRVIKALRRAGYAVVPGGKHSIVTDAAGNFLLDGNKSLTLTGGTYYVRDFTLTGMSTLNVSGPTTIYVTGNFTRAGSATLTNTTATPGNFQVMMTGGTATITSSNALYGVIYAPNTAVTVDGDSDLYGAVVGKTLTLTGTGDAHYDESLNLDGLEFPKRTTLVD